LLSPTRIVSPVLPFNSQTALNTEILIGPAQRLCSHAIYVPPDFTRYREVSKQIRQIFAHYTDVIEPLSLDEAYLDVTENKVGLASATDVAQAIRRDIAQTVSLTASAGIAPNKFLAKIASDWNKPDGFFVIRPKQIMAFLQPLPVRKMPGVGKVMQARLEACGIYTLGDLGQRSLIELEQHFGRYGRRLHELAQGIDDSEVQVDQVAQQVSAETTFETDLPLNALAASIDKLAKRVWDQSLKKGMFGRTVVLKLKTDRFCLLTCSVTTQQPPMSAQALADVVRQLCERVNLAGDTSYRLVGVGVSNFAEPGEVGRQAELAFG
jgi:DNA polymerase IV